MPLRKLLFFMMVSLDGFFEGPDHDLSWHNVDAEFNEFAIAQLETADVLLFGRVTYEMMATFWPSTYAVETDPIVSNLMNSKAKLVCSTTLPTASWSNTQLLKQDAGAEIARLKQQPGRDMLLLGSSGLAVTLTRLGLIDEYRIMVNPVVLGQGRALLHGLEEPLKLRLIKSRPFRNGNTLLSYERS